MKFDLWALDDSELDPYQFRVFCHIARVGICYQSVHTIAEECHISSGKASTTRKWLEENGYIEKAKEPKSGRMGWRIVQFWDSPDEQTQQNYSPDEQNVHDVNGNVHQMNGNVHDVNLRNTTIRQTTEEYIHTGVATDDQILPLIESLKKVAKQTYTNGRHSEFDDIALTLYGWDATPKEIEQFGAWWEANCWYDVPSKAALKTIVDSWQKFKQSITAKERASAEYVPVEIDGTIFMQRIDA